MVPRPTKTASNSKSTQETASHGGDFFCSNQITAGAVKTARNTAKTSGTSSSSAAFNPASTITSEAAVLSARPLEAFVPLVEALSGRGLKVGSVIRWSRTLRELRAGWVRETSLWADGSYALPKTRRSWSRPRSLPDFSTTFSPRSIRLRSDRQRNDPCRGQTLRDEDGALHY